MEITINEGWIIGHLILKREREREREREVEREKEREGKRKKIAFANWGNEWEILTKNIYVTLALSSFGWFARTVKGLTKLLR